MKPELKIDESWKYDIQALEPESDEFEFIRHFLTTTKTRFLFEKKQVEVVQIYKVIEQHAKEPHGGSSNNLMLFHATKGNGAAGILQNGFFNSRDGMFGAGVYMTDCSSTAAHWGRFGKDDGLMNIFVNEVLQSENLQTVAKDPLKYYNYPTEFAFAKHAGTGSRELSEEDYKRDHLGRRYRNIQVEDKFSEEYVADCKLVIPRYLIRAKLDKKIKMIF